MVNINRWQGGAAFMGTLCSAPQFSWVLIHHTLTFNKKLEAMLPSIKALLNIRLSILLSRNFCWIEVVGTKSAFSLTCCRSPHPRGCVPSAEPIAFPVQPRCEVLKVWLVFVKRPEIRGRKLSEEGKILQNMSVLLYLLIGSGIPWRWKVLHKCEILIISWSITHAKVRQTYFYLVNICAVLFQICLHMAIGQIGTTDET